MIYTEKIRYAMCLAEGTHHGQRDKGDYPYIFHPLHLAEQMGDNENLIIIALLHDVLEDGDFKSTDWLETHFPKEVIEALQLLTHKKCVPYFDYIKAIKPNFYARIVKMADLRHNLEDARVSANSVEEFERIQERMKKYKAALDYLEDKREDFS